MKDLQSGDKFQQSLYCEFDRNHSRTFQGIGCTADREFDCWPRCSQHCRHPIRCFEQRLEICQMNNDHTECWSRTEVLTVTRGRTLRCCPSRLSAVCQIHVEVRRSLVCSFSQFWFLLQLVWKNDRRTDRHRAEVMDISNGQFGCRSLCLSGNSDFLCMSSDEKWIDRR